MERALERIVPDFLAPQAHCNRSITHLLRGGLYVYRGISGEQFQDSKAS
jgi:hypothetical protein